MATYDSDGSLNGNPNSVQTLVDGAADGDTVTIPGGIFPWSSPGLNINKAITLSGLTTISKGPTPIDCSFNDVTVIQDNTTGENAVINAKVLPITANPFDWSVRLRITGISFLGGTRGLQSGSGAIKVGGLTQNHIPVRIDHCHIATKQVPSIYWFEGFGVIDHCYIETFDESLHPAQEHWIGPAGGAPGFGDGSWNDFPYFGSNKFLFVEDNYFDKANGGSTVDGYRGGRAVIRYNTYHNVGLSQYHGTETSQRGRGHRCTEVYENDVYYDAITINNPEIRSGGLIEHNNRWHITDTAHQFGGQRINCYRNNGPFNFWNGANGVNVIDRLDPTLYYSGFATAGSGNLLLIDTNANGGLGWPNPNLLKGYVVVNLTQVAPFPIPESGQQGPKNAQGDNYHGTAHSNTATQITFLQGTPDTLNVTFAVNDQYEIRKVLQVLDQPGAGKGDLLIQNPGNRYINGLQSGFYNVGQTTHLHQALEPIMWWGNTQSIYPGGSTTGVNTPTIILSDDGPNITGTFQTSGATYYNLGPLVTGHAPSQMTTLYDATLNGTPYTGTFTYPHPLTGAATGKIIDVPVSHDFGNIVVLQQGTFNIPVQNLGDQLLTVTGVTYPTGFSGPTGSFAVASLQTVFKLCTFSPTAETTYTGSVVFASNADSGNGTMVVTGVGVQQNTGGGQGKGHKKGALSRRT